MKPITITPLTKREALAGVRKHAVRPPQIHQKKKGRRSYNRKSKTNQL